MTYEDFDWTPCCDVDATFPCKLGDVMTCPECGTQWRLDYMEGDYHEGAWRRHIDWTQLTTEEA